LYVVDLLGQQIFRGGVIHRAALRAPTKTAEKSALRSSDVFEKASKVTLGKLLTPRGF
jgi:hypothetical protein